MTVAIGLLLVAALAAVVFLVAMLQRLLKLALFVAVVGTAAVAGWLVVRDHAPAPVRDAVVHASDRVGTAGEAAARDLAARAVAEGKKVAGQAKDAAVRAAAEAVASEAAPTAPAPASSKAPTAR